MQQVSVIIPAYNEEDAIRTTVEQVRATLDAAGIEHEILVVSDGSSDATAELAAEAGARVLSHLQNLGYGRSLKTGIEAANNDTIVITDADGTYPIDKIPELVGVYSRGFHMVVGQRTGKHYRENMIKAPSRVLFKWLVEFTTGRRIPDVNSGLRVFSRAEAMRCFSQLSNSFSFTTSITLALMLQHKFVEYIPIPYYQRIGKTKVKLVRDAMRTLQYIIQAALYYNPLKIFLVVCLGSLLLSLLLFTISFIISSPPWAWAGLCFIMTAIIVFAIGLLGEILHRNRVDAAERD